MATSLTLSLTPHGAHVTLVGELDVDVYAALSWRLAEVLDHGCPALVLDATGVTFVDVACVRLVDRVRQALALQGRELRVVGASSAIERVCVLAGHDELARAVRAGRGVAPGPLLAAVVRDLHVALRPLSAS